MDPTSVLGAWTAGRGPLYRRLATAIRAAIERGELQAGDRLPAERELAAQLAVSRSTAVAAYDELRADGEIERRRGSGTFVSRREAPQRAEERPSAAVLSGILAGLWTGPGPLIELTSASLSGDGIVTPADLEAASRDLREVLPSHGYSPYGLPALRRSIAAYLSERGLRTSEDEILVTSGAQQAIALSASLLVGPGDVAVVENPSFPGAIDALRAAGAQLAAIPVDADGGRTDALRILLERHRPRAAYVCTMFHSPTGALMSEPRRRELARIALEYDLPVIDDTALGELSLCGSVGPPAAAFAPRATFLTIGSMSKLCWGGLRVGWVRGPIALIERLARSKIVADHGTALLDQLLAVRLLARVGEVREIRAAQIEERLATLTHTLAERVPEWTFVRPAGGLLAWVRLPRGNAVAFSQLALRHGVAVVPGSVTSIDGGMTEYLRLPFAAPPEVLVEGLTRLADAYRAYVAGLDGAEAATVLV